MSEEREKEEGSVHVMLSRLGIGTPFLFVVFKFKSENDDDFILVQ